MKVLTLIGFILLIIFNIQLGKEKRKKEVALFQKENEEFQKAQEWVETKLEKISEHKKIRRRIQSVIENYATVNSLSKVKSKKILIRKITLTLIVSVGVAIGILIFLKSILASILSLIVVIYASYTHESNKYYKTLKKMETDFPETIQIFADNYCIHMNIYNAMEEVVEKTEGPTQRIFEKTFREIESGANKEQSLREFARLLGFYYAHAFVETLLLADEMGDISESLNFLINLIQEDLELKEESRSSHFENKVMYKMLNILTIVGAIGNMFKFDFSTSLYLFTPTGNALIIAFFAQLIITSVYSIISEGR